MIYTFHPIYKETLWGGQRLSAYKGVDFESEHVGESWEISDVDGSVSVVDAGRDAGTDLGTLVKRHGAKLLGASNVRRFGNHFPLLIKFLDASQDLSVQVHPGDETAGRLHGSKGKTEMWYILDGGDDAEVLIGFNRQLNKEQLRERIEAGTLPEVLERYPSRKGDVFYIPAGRVHSAGAGTLLAEIQQTSDLTYRLFDYNRRDSDGRLRPLQVERALDALDYAASTKDRINYNAARNCEVRLVDSPYFATRLYDLSSPFSIDLDETDSFVAVLVLDGDATFTDGEDVIRAARGRTLLVGASSRLLAVTPGRKGVKILTATISSED